MALAIKMLTREFDDRRVIFRVLFDGGTFSGSAMIVWGIIDPVVLDLLGDTKPFLIFAGLAGLIYSLGVLVPESPGWRR